jgi:hypothetical protein
MELADYVVGVLEHGAHATLFPDKLDLPHDMAVEFLSLYKRGEEHAHEFGYNLTWSPEREAFVFSDIYSGDKTSTPLRTMSHFENCADVHCHPTESIGEKGGFSPHSPEDLLAFKAQIDKGKPLYIKFVVTGNLIYAMVYRRGLSWFDEEPIYMERESLLAEQDRYFQEHCPYTHEERQRLENPGWTEEAIREAEELHDQLKARTPGFGQHQMEQTRLACEKVAHLLKLGFYAGTGRTLNRLA